MLRCLVVVTACLFAVPAVWSQDKKQDDKKPQGPAKLTVSWHGQSFFSVYTKAGKLFVFDPHGIPQYGILPPMSPDLIFISHNHPDHTQTGVFENVREKAAKQPRVINGLQKGANGKEDWNLIDETFEGMKIKSIGVYHDDVQGMKHGKTTIFIVEVDGWRICHLGDLGHSLSPKQLKELGELDVVMIPCGGIYGLNGKEANVVLRQLKVKEFVFPMHIGTAIYDDLLPVDEFIDDSPYKCAIVREGALVYSDKPRDNIVWLRRNSKNSDNTIELERDPKRKGPVIVNLHYWPAEKKKK